MLTCNCNCRAEFIRPYPGSHHCAAHIVITTNNKKGLIHVF